MQNNFTQKKSSQIKNPPQHYRRASIGGLNLDENYINFLQEKNSMKFKKVS